MITNAKQALAHLYTLFQVEQMNLAPDLMFTRESKRWWDGHGEAPLSAVLRAAE